MFFIYPLWMTANLWTIVISITLRLLMFTCDRDLKVDGCDPNYVKTVTVFHKFYYFFCRRHSLMNLPCYNNLFEFIQHGNFQYLNRVICTHRKQLESWVNAFLILFSSNLTKYISLFEEIGSFSKKTELFRYIAIVWYMVLSKFSDIFS